jgi:sarcosine oxidase, subunit alpha
MRREEIVVVGAGVAGVMAALAARKNGASVTLIDEQVATGGYLRSAIGVQRGLGDRFNARRGFELAGEGWNELYDAGVNVQLRSTAWGLFDDNVLGIVNPDTSYQLRADRIIIATGSSDIAIPFAGWDLPGVMTARAALIAINVYRVLPGLKVALVGSGSDLVEVRESLQAAGVTITIHASDVSTVEAGGSGQVEWVSSGGDRVVVDAAITVHGVQPDFELALQALARTAYSGISGVHVPLRSETLESTVSGVWIAGDSGGLCTTAEAAAEGTLAGEIASDGKKVDELIERLHDARSPERLAEMRSMQTVSSS